MVEIEFKVADFHSSLTNYEYADVKTAIEKFEEVGMSTSDLVDKVREFNLSTETSIHKIDVCYVAYDHILYMARSKIDEILDFDICDVIKVGAGFYLCGDHRRISFGYSQDVKDQLEEELKDAGTEQIEELLDDISVKVFLKDVGIYIEAETT